MSSKSNFGLKKMIFHEKFPIINESAWTYVYQIFPEIDVSSKNYYCWKDEKLTKLINSWFFPSSSKQTKSIKWMILLPLPATLFFLSPFLWFRNMWMMNALTFNDEENTQTAYVWKCNQWIHVSIDNAYEVACSMNWKWLKRAF